MIGRDSDEDLNACGLAPWIAGVVLAAILIGAMFGFAASIR
jgi:hypothetical protein